MKKRKSTLHLKHDEIELLRKNVLELSSRKSVAEKLDSQHVESLKKTKSNSLIIEQNKTTLEMKRDELDKSIKETVDTMRALQVENERVNKKITEITIRIMPLEEKVESIIGVQGKILENVDKGRKNFAIAERHTLQSQLKVEKIRDQIANIQSKIEEDFGIINAGEETEYGFDQPLAPRRYCGKSSENRRITGRI